MVDLMPQKEKIFGDPSGRLSGTATVGDRTYKAYEPKIQTPRLDMMPAELKKREEYKDISYKKYGASKTRPHMSEGDISNMVDFETSSEELGLWEHVFGDQARYEDRKHLSINAQNAWKNALLKMRKNIDGEIRGELKSQQDEHDQKQGRVDAEMKVYDDYQKQYGKSKKDEKPKYTPADLRAVHKTVKDLNKKGESVTPGDLAVLKDLTKDMPFDVKDELIKKGAQPWWWFNTEDEYGLSITPKGADMTPAKAQTQRKIVRTGKKGGRKVVQYDDGSVEYAD